MDSYSPAYEHLDLPETYHDFVIQNLNALIAQCPADKADRPGWIKACNSILRELARAGKYPDQQIEAFLIMMADKIGEHSFQGIHEGMKEIFEQEAA